ncbi:hypothetical protein AOLI_G00258330 [Acnodon oligacanthus]
MIPESPTEPGQIITQETTLHRCTMIGSLRKLPFNKETGCNVYVGVTVPVCGKERCLARCMETLCFGCWQDPKRKFGTKSRSILPSRLLTTKSSGVSYLIDSDETGGFNYWLHCDSLATPSPVVLASVWRTHGSWGSTNPRTGAECSSLEQPKLSNKSRIG